MSIRSKKVVIPVSGVLVALIAVFLLGRFGPPESRQHERMGYTIRTDRYRYVEWYTWDKELKIKGELLTSELFDHASDPGENLNLAQDTSYSQTISALSQQLNQGWKYALPEY